VKIKSIIVSGALAGLVFASTLSASTPVYKKGCEFPLTGVQVCWEATSSANVDHAPYDELHMLPITRMVGGSEEVLVDTTRKIFRQMLPSAMAERLIPEWSDPVFYLEDAMMSGQDYGWPAYMWISPRVMRNSSEMNSGLVDWDVYFFSNNKLTRTLRIRVESKPKRTDNRTEIMAAASATLFFSSTVSPFVSSAASYGAGTMAVADPPEAGQSLEIMTELATRQILYLAQYSINDMASPTPPKDTILTTVKKHFEDLKGKMSVPK
jgi:hypothetical protein